MSYTKGILVLPYRNLQNRCVELSVGDSSINESGHLSDLDLDSINEIINELTLLINNNLPNDYYQWGVDLFTVTSLPNISHCENEIEGIQLPEVSTSTLLDFMIELKNFKEQYFNFPYLKNEVKEAFLKIKLNPNKYKMSKDSEFHYLININNINFLFVLEPDDFYLQVDEYINQLQPIS